MMKRQEAKQSTMYQNAASQLKTDTFSDFSSNTSTSKTIWQLKGKRNGTTSYDTGCTSTEIRCALFGTCLLTILSVENFPSQEANFWKDVFQQWEPET